MNKIKILAKQISDKIAAGEVVTGPISVVKELVENSIDAGANSITVEIKDGGKSYIRITDNGSGIPADQVELAFKPHATSKIAKEDDLDSINTLGFRGEALTSIAAVSKLEMITKPEDDRVGISIYMEGGEIIEKKDTGANKGTTIIVKDLYFNTPARMKFMKSDRSESTKIIDLISRIAIAYPEIKIRLVNNENILFSTTGKGDVLNNIFQVYGTETKDDLMLAERKSDDYKLRAYISPSSYTKKTRRNQIYFVNGRVVNNKTIENAISRGYEEFVFEGRYPVAYVFLEINPLKLDVNVHPAKTEVRFNEPPTLSQFIYNTIYDRLKTKEAIPDITPKSPGRQKKESIFKFDDNKMDFDPTFYENEKKAKDKTEKIEQVNIKTLMTTKYDDNGKINENDSPIQSGTDEITIKTSDTGDNSGIKDNYEKTVYEDEATYDSKSEPKSKRPKGMEELDIKNLKVMDSIFATYILATDDDNIYIIDQHAAHERINYELFLNQFHTNEKLSQQILEPIVINVSAASMNNIEPWIELINKLGYESEIFGDRSIIVKAIPAFLEFHEAENMIKDIIDNMDNNVPRNHVAIEKLIQRSCKASIKANHLLKLAEIKVLLTELSKCENPFSCPHGRPVFVKLSKYDVEKLFRRV